MSGMRIRRFTAVHAVAVRGGEGAACRLPAARRARRRGLHQPDEHLSAGDPGGVEQASRRGEVFSGGDSRQGGGHEWFGRDDQSRRRGKAGSSFVRKHIERDPLSVHQRGWIGDTPLHWPSHNNNVEIVTMLLDAGATSRPTKSTATAASRCTGRASTHRARFACCWSAARRQQPQPQGRLGVLRHDAADHERDAGRTTAPK
jgi:hypothetical protein